MVENNINPVTGQYEEPEEEYKVKEDLLCNQKFVKTKTMIKPVKKVDGDGSPELPDSGTDNEELKEDLSDKVSEAEPLLEKGI